MPMKEESSDVLINEEIFAYQSFMIDLYIFAIKMLPWHN